MLIMNVFEEDVVKFERSKGMNSSSRGSRANKNDDPNEESGGSDDEPSVAPPAKKVSDGILYTPPCRLHSLAILQRPSAARSIMAFLQGQSESEGEGA